MISCSHFPSTVDYLYEYNTTEKQFKKKTILELAQCNKEGAVMTLSPLSVSVTELLFRAQRGSRRAQFIYIFTHIDTYICGTEAEGAGLLGQGRDLEAGVLIVSTGENRAVL